MPTQSKGLAPPATITRKAHTDETASQSRKTNVPINKLRLCVCVLSFPVNELVRWDEKMSRQCKTPRVCGTLRAQADKGGKAHNLISRCLASCAAVLHE
jgi:hypothetical protein